MAHKTLPTMVHQITIKDVEGLDKTLLDEGYTLEEIEHTGDFIMDLFDKAAVMVFRNILASHLPESVEIRLVRDKEPVFDVWHQSIELAGLCIESSQPNHLVFLVREFMFRSIIDEEDNGYYIVTAVHEMMHAADLPILKNEIAYLDAAKRKVENYETAYGRERKNPYKIVYDLVSLLYHYRSEGIAIVGDRLLSKRAFDQPPYGLLVFHNRISDIFWYTMYWLTKDEKKDDLSYETMDSLWKMAYEAAPIIQLTILLRRGSISKETMEKIEEGFRTGYYPLTDEEISSIIRQMLSISLVDYLRGLFFETVYGKTILPKQPLINFQNFWLERYKNVDDNYLIIPKTPDELEELRKVLENSCSLSFP